MFKILNVLEDHVIILRRGVPMEWGFLVCQCVENIIIRKLMKPNFEKCIEREKGKSHFCALEVFSLFSKNAPRIVPIFRIQVESSTTNHLTKTSRNVYKHGVFGVD